MSTSDEQHERHEHSHDQWHDMPDSFIEHLELEAALSLPLTTALLDEIAPTLDRAPQQILDIGSGIGAGTAALAARFAAARVHALDINEQLLQRVIITAQAAEVFDRVDTHVIDLNRDQLPAPAPGIDLAWASLSLHHVDDPALALSKVFDALRPGGAFVLTEFAGPVRPEPADLGTHIAGFSTRITPALSAPAEYLGIDWPTLLDAAGFTTVAHFERDFVVDTGTDEGIDYLERTLRKVREQVASELSEDELAHFDSVIDSLRSGGPTLSLSSPRAVWVAVRDKA